VRLWSLVTTAVLAGAAALVHANECPPVPYIVTITVDGHAGGANTNFPPGRGDVAIDYIVDETVDELRYKLEGFDTGWVDAKGRRRATYTGVPGGRYRFMVEARRNGAWNGTAAAIGIRTDILRMPTFQLLAAAAVLAVLAAAFRTPAAPRG
jgi:hypothetical protein